MGVTSIGEKGSDTKNAKHPSGRVFGVGPLFASGKPGANALRLIETNAVFRFSPFHSGPNPFRIRSKSLPMQIDPSDLSTRDLYSWMVRLITPRPIAWVSTISIGGVANLAPFSFFSGLGANPPTVLFCPANNRFGQPKDTLTNVLSTGQFVVNLVTESDAEAMNMTSCELEADVDEFDFASVDKTPCQVVSPPRVATASAAMECELHEAIALGSGPGGANLVIGRIVWIHLADRLIDSQGEFDARQLDTIGRMGGDDYVRTSDRFTMPRPPRPKRKT